MEGRLGNIALGCLIVGSLAGCKSASKASKCSADDVVAPVKQLGADDSDDPQLAKLKEVGVGAVVTLDAIRTISSAPKVAVCEGRLTQKLTLLPHHASDPPETPGEPERRAQMEKALGLGDATVLDLTYKVEKTDDGNDYVTIIPSDTQASRLGISSKTTTIISGKCRMSRLVTLSASAPTSSSPTTNSSRNGARASNS